jgi:prepilin-type N-terminal cleavage/methylation domain-containing protein
MGNAFLNTAHRGRGYALSELMLAVSVFALLAAIASGSYMTMKRTNQSSDQALTLVKLSNDIRGSWRPTGTFATLTGSAVTKLGLVQKPIVSDGTNLFDIYSNTIQLAGGPTYFAIALGGNGAMSSQECTNLATSMQEGAFEVRVGAAAALGTGAALGRTTGGYLYKSAGTTYDVTALQSGCAEANTVIAMSFDG